MASPFEGLPSVFVGALGEAVTLWPYSVAAAEVSGIVVHRPEDEFGQVIRRAVVHLRSADMAGLSDGDRVSLRGVVYLAKSFLPDGRGMTAVHLEAEA